MSIEIPLIKEIEKHQCLYDFNLPEYNRKDVLDAAWAEVAAKCELNVPECKDKWKNIRSSFVRNLRRPSGGKWKKPYYLSSYLKFIVPFLKPIGNIEVTTEDQQTEGEESNEYGNNTDIDVEPITSIKVESLTDFENDDLDFEDPNLHDYDIDLLSNQSMPKKRRRADAKNTELTKNKKRKSLTNSRTDKNNNAMRYFLLSLLPDFETMNEEQIRMFKMKTIMLIDDIKTDYNQMKNQNSNSTNKDSESLKKGLLIDGDL